MKITEIKDQENNCLIEDNSGAADNFYCLEKFNWDPVIKFNSDKPHAAFRMNNNIILDRIYIAQYQATNINGVARSLPGMIPAVNINYDDAVGMCKAKGPGYHLFSIAERHALALIARRDGTVPFGNTDYCKSHENKNIKGLPVDSYKNAWLTGSGGPLTSHNHKNGVYDLSGNVYDWISGFKFMSGAVHLNGRTYDGFFIADNDITRNELDYRSIAKIECKSNRYKNIKITESNMKNAEYILESVGLLAMRDEEYKDDICYMPQWSGEALPIVGGGWIDGSAAGLFALLGGARTGAGSYIGFRLAFYNL